jgi:hypothetical protein
VARRWGGNTALMSSRPGANTSPRKKPASVWLARTSQN